VVAWNPEGVEMLAVLIPYPSKTGAPPESAGLVLRHDVDAVTGLRVNLKTVGVSVIVWKSKGALGPNHDVCHTNLNAPNLGANFSELLNC
jgi:hypothetical protein